MSCGRCGAGLREGAKFCPRCGAPVGAPGRRDSPLGGVEAEILAIAGAIQAGAPDRAALLAELAAEREPGVRAVVIGDAGRGRTSVANLLLEAEILPLRPGLGSVVLTAGPVWSLDGVEGPFVGSPGAHRAEGPAALLKWCSLADLPPMNPAMFGDVLFADIVVIVLSATQLLSSVERTTLLEQVLPRCVGAVALAVTRMDAVESDEDQADLDRRLARFVEQAGRELPIFPVRKGSGGGLGAWVTDAAIAAKSGRSERWARRVRFALEGVEALPLPDTGPDRATIEAAIRGEAALSLAEAEAVLREGLARLRATLPDRLAELSPDRLRAEASVTLTHEVTHLGREVAAAYLGALERALVARPDEVSRATGSGLAAGTAGEAARLAPGAKAPQVAGSRPRNAASMALGAAGLVTLAAVGGPVGLASGAAMLYGAWAVRKGQQERFDADLARDTRAAVREWLDTVERELTEGLAALSADVVTRLLERAFALVPEGTGLGAAELAAKVEALREQVRG